MSTRTAEETSTPNAPPIDASSLSALHGEASKPTEQDAPAEADRPRVGSIGVAIVATLALLAVVVIGVNEVFKQVMTSEVSSKVLTRPSDELRELRAEEELKLTRYQWVSEKDGVVRLPLPRAVELTLADYRARSARLEPVK